MKLKVCRFVAPVCFWASCTLAVRRGFRGQTWSHIRHTFDRFPSAEKCSAVQKAAAEAVSNGNDGNDSNGGNAMHVNFVVFKFDTTPDVCCIAENEEKLLVLTAGAGNILRIAPALTVPRG